MNGSELRALREGHRLSRMQLANMIGSKHSAIWCVENDKAPQGDRNGATKARMEEALQGLSGGSTVGAVSTNQKPEKPAPARPRGRSATPAADPVYPDSWIVSEEWNGFNVGDPVRVLGEPGAFRFVKHVLNTELGKEWVDVTGGSARDPRHFRSFYVDRITRPKAGKRKSPGEDIKDIAWRYTLDEHELSFPTYGDAKAWADKEQPFMKEGQIQRVLNHHGAIVFEYPSQDALSTAARERLGVDV